MTIVVLLGFKSFNVYQSDLKMAKVISMNCNQLHNESRGIYVQVGRDTIRLSQKCHNFIISHDLNDKIAVLVNYEKKLAYLPSNKNIGFIFAMSLLFVPFALSYLKKNEGNIW